MLYLAGEIVLWMVLSFALGLLVGWFVWGLRQRRVAAAPAAPAVAAPAPAAESALESVTVRPAIRPVEPPPVEAAFPETPAAGTPVVPPAPPAPGGAPTVPAPAEPVVPDEPVAAPAPAPMPAPVPVPEPEPVANESLASLVNDGPAWSEADAPTGEHPVAVARPAAAPEDLQVVEGVGPAIEQLLRESGITTLDELAATSPERLRTILDLAGDQFRVHDPRTWPRQAALAAAGQWDDLATLQATLHGGTHS